MLAGKRVVLGVTGGIAAYKAIEVCRRLVDLGAHVTPVLTNAAHNMVGPTTFTALASEPVKTSMFSDADPIPHTRLGQEADVIVVCPATARIISDLRTGRSADLLSATLVATASPVVVCPAMHTEMWEHLAVQDNIEVLRSRGVVIVNPEDGRLAGGDIGKGRLANPATIVEAVIEAVGQAVGATEAARAAGPLVGRQVVVTAGGTRERIDPVRYLGNRSTGRQGHALAGVAAEMGASVTLITTSSLPSPTIVYGSGTVDRVDVESAADMHNAVLDVADEADIIIMNAAVADFRPVAVADQKIKKADGTPEIRLEPTVDILADLGTRKSGSQVLVGFAAETNDVVANAMDKLKRKGADILVANDVSAPGVGFAHHTNAVTIFAADGSVSEVGLGEKRAIAEAVLRVAIDRLPTNESS